MNETSFQGELFAMETAAPYVLTVKQPWAWAIIHAGKDVENRSRPIRYRGQLLIQAGKGHAAEGDAWLRRHDIEPPADLPRGFIIGAVQVVGSTRTSTSRWAMRNHHHWLLAEQTPATTLLPCRGTLNLFRAPANWEQAFTAEPAAGTRKKE
jgi:hypothetical protein